MKVVYTKRAEKDFESLSKSTKKRIAEKMRFYLSKKDPFQFAKRIKDNRLGDYCFRIGDYRVIFDMGKDKLVILRIRRRDKAYD